MVEKNEARQVSLIAMRTFSLVGSILLLAASPVRGQRLASPFPTAAAPVFTVPWAAMDSQRVIPPTYWLEGGVIGGVVVGALGASLAAGFCGYSDSQQGSCADDTIKGAFWGAVLGFSVGALIGGQIRKHRKQDLDP
jgi:hypothetical protein